MYAPRDRDGNYLKLATRMSRRVHPTVLLFLGCKDAFLEAAQGVEGGVFADPASVAGPTHRRAHSVVVASAERKMT